LIIGLGSSLLQASSKPTLLFYCGITMVTPMKVIAQKIEKQHNCTIKIIQGGSQDLYNSLKLAKKGDLYLPGSDSYRKKNLKEGLLLDGTFVGYNQASIFVKKGNPKGIKNLDDLVNEDIGTVLCNPKSGSIGKMTKKILTKYKGDEFFEDAFDMAAEIGTDSRSLNSSLKKPEIDMSINWKATAYLNDNLKHIDIVDIDVSYSPKKKLVLNLLSFSKHKDIARSFMDYAASDEGKKIMKKYGFR
jgi:molybdate transport system substrate-binding protein